MSADLLRRAAALMRERANDAILATGDEPWKFCGTTWNDNRGTVYMVGAGPVNVCDSITEEQAEHIAAWDPAVALAVADWLEAVAEVHWPKRSDRYSESHYSAEPEHLGYDGQCDESCFVEAYICNGCGTAECKPEITAKALAVASAYLGADA